MQKVSNRITYCGVADSGRKIFDQLVPLPQGTTYNSYIVKGDSKCVLIDTTYAPFVEKFVDSIVAECPKLDYIISNHAEPDHSSAIPNLLEVFPDAKVLCSKMCAVNLQNMLGVDPVKIQVVSDAEVLDLGGATLKFFMTPHVHWPDTMMCFLEEEKALFSCDFLGAHYTKALYSDDSTDLAEHARRYYAEIMMPFAPFCRKYVALVEGLAPSMILTGHGAIYKNPEFILNLYRTWTSPEPSKKVLIPYISMYGNTTLMAEYLANALSERGLIPVLADISELDEGEIAMALIDAGAIVFGASMVLNGAHPKSIYAANLVSVLRPKAKFWSMIGSMGWGGNLTIAFESVMKNSKMEFLPAVIAKGRPLGEDFAALDALATTLKEKMEG